MENTHKVLLLTQVLFFLSAAVSFVLVELSTSLTPKDFISPTITALLFLTAIFVALAATRKQ